VAVAAHCGALAAGLAGAAVGLPVLPAHGLLGGGGGAGAGTRAFPGTGWGHTRASGLASVPESFAVRSTDRIPFRRTDAAASPTRPTFPTEAGGESVELVPDAVLSTQHHIDREALGVTGLLPIGAGGGGGGAGGGGAGLGGGTAGTVAAKSRLAVGTRK